MCVLQKGEIKVSDGTVIRWKVVRLLSTLPKDKIISYWDERVDESIMETGTRKSVEIGSGFCCFKDKKDALKYTRWHSLTPTTRANWHERITNKSMKLRMYYIPKGEQYIDGILSSQVYGKGLPASRARKLVRKERLL